jgi:O-antigen/teichoic acid export membrane protein
MLTRYKSFFFSFKGAQRFHSVGHLVSLGLLHILSASILIQGLSYVVQFILALTLSPDKFAVVRTTESVFSSLLPLAAAGMGGIATKVGASVMSTSELRFVFRNMQRVVLLCSGLAIIIGLFFISFTQEGTDRLIFFCILLLLPFASLLRLFLGILQGRMRMKETGQVTLVASLIACVLTVLLTLSYELHGWIVGRILSEFLLFFLLLKLLSRTVFSEKTEGEVDNDFCTDYSVRSLAFLGGTVACSSTVRAWMDNIGIISLQFMNAQKQVIGEVGLSLLVIQGVLLPLGAVITLLTPGLAQTLDPRASCTPEARLKSFSEGHKTIMIFSGLLVAISFVTVFVLLRQFGGSYAGAFSSFSILVLLIPARALNSYYGTILTLRNRPNLTLILNIIFLALGFLVIPSSYEWGGIYALAGVVVLAEWLSAIIHYRFVWRGNEGQYV